MYCKRVDVFILYCSQHKALKKAEAIKWRCMLIHVKTQPIFFLDMPDTAMLKNLYLNKNIQKCYSIEKFSQSEVKGSKEKLNKVQKCKQNLHLTSMIAENQVDYYFIWQLNENHSLYNLSILNYKAVGLVLTSVGRLTSSYRDAKCFFWKQRSAVVLVSKEYLSM